MKRKQAKSNWQKKFVDMINETAKENLVQQKISPDLRKANRITIKDLLRDEFLEC